MPRKPERDRHLARHHADDADGDGVGSDVAPAVGEEVAILRFADVDAAAAAADDHSGAGLVDPQAGVVPRLARGNHGQQRRARVAPGIGARLAAVAVLAVERLGVGDRDRRHRRGHLARDRSRRRSR